jgi:hypothetical protein
MKITKVTRPPPWKAVITGDGPAFLHAEVVDGENGLAVGALTPDHTIW